MAFKGPLACPSCQHTVPLENSYTWRLKGPKPLYRCPQCDHSFRGRDWIDLGANSAVQSLMHRERGRTLRRLQDCLLEASAEQAREVIEGEYSGVTVDELKQTLELVYDPSSREFAALVEAARDVTPTTRFFADVQADVVRVYKEYPAVWNTYLRLGGDPTLPAVPSVDPDWRVQRIADVIDSHAHRQPLLHLCFLADTIEDVLAPLRSYARYNAEAVCAVQSVRDVVDLMAAHTHIIVNITAGKRWLPSKALLDAQWGDRLLVDDCGDVLGREPSSRSGLQSNGVASVSYRRLAVPEGFYLGFFSDRPFDPPPYFLSRAGGRFLDWRSADAG